MSQINIYLVFEKETGESGGGLDEDSLDDIPDYYHPAPSPTSLEKTAQKAAYQQAIHDFAITELLTKLQNFSKEKFDSQPITEPEIELIAALLVQQLASHLDSHLVATYLKGIRQGNREIVPEPISLQYPESTELPNNFPSDTNPPRFIVGARLRLGSVPINGEIETETDTGRCIGHYLAYAPHQCRWMWKYVIWLDKDSLSASWCVATMAWEDELYPVSQKEPA
jgi:hypothetical protein